MVKDLSIKYICLNCNKEVKDIPVIEGWCSNCFHKEVKRSQEEDVPDKKIPWERTRPPRYRLKREEYAIFGY